MEPYLAQIMLFAGNFAPRGWAFCDGQILQISSNAALFALLGTTYGGDGVRTFALPDLRGRVPVHAGATAGTGLTPRTAGQAFGAETVTLTVQQLPAHTHGTSYELPHTEVMTTATPAVPVAYDRDPSSVTAVLQSHLTGGGQPVAISQPSLGLHYIIATSGIFPSRD